MSARFSVAAGGGLLNEADRTRQNIREMEQALQAKRVRLAEIEGGAPAAAPAKGNDKADKKKAAEAKPAAAKPAAEPKKPAVRDWRFDLVRAVGEECQEDEELALLLSKKQTGFRFYDGFEPSGRMHIAQGLFKTINVNRCTKAGGTFVFWVADWFALMNDKMGGDIDKIRVVGEYLIEVWKAAGMSLDNVEFVWSSDEINKKADEYWVQMLDIARYFTVNRMMRCCQIMGRQEGSLTCAQLLYPMMQCTDIFFLRADICQLGLDQKKVNMLAREYCTASSRKGHKPIILSHHMMYGLLEGQDKMSKSDEMSAIFMEDDAEKVRTKINGAWCPLTKGEKSPLLDLLTTLVFVEPDVKFEAGAAAYTSTAQVEDAVVAGTLKPQELRDALSASINAKLEPVRKHFAENERPREILALIKKWKEEMAKEKAQPKKEERAPLDDNGVLIPLMVSQQATLNQMVTAGQAAKKYAAQGKKVRVLILDWTAYVLNVVNGDMKAIRRLSDYTATLLKAFLGATENVEVAIQSEVVLADAEKYWVGVINVGRSISLNDMGAAMKKDYVKQSEGEGANEVIAAMMMQEDVYFGGYKTVASPHSQYAGVIALTGADVVTLEDVLPCSRETFLGVEPSLNGIYPEMAQSQILLLEDDDMSIQSVVKKAFCTPEVAEGNPILLAAGGLMQVTNKPLTITKKGGDATAFTSFEALHAAYGTGAVHPGDLKPAVTAAMKAFYAELRAPLAKDKEFATLHNHVCDHTLPLCVASLPPPPLLPSTPPCIFTVPAHRSAI